MKRAQLGLIIGSRGLWVFHGVLAGVLQGFEFGRVEGLRGLAMGRRSFGFRVQGLGYWFWRVARFRGFAFMFLCFFVGCGLWWFQGFRVWHDEP